MAELRLAIIADDLTGALDTAAPFAALPGGVTVATRPEALGVALDRAPAVVAVSTRSRAIPPRAARAAVAAALAELPRDTLIIKKIDSRLKGNIAAELTAVSGPLTVLPAIPDFGRVVRDGALQGFGVDTPIPVAGALGEAADRATVPDVETPEQMAAALAAAGDSVLVGARGLAQALAARWGLGPPPRASLPAPSVFVIGSTDPITRAQVATLAAARPETPRVDAPGGEVPVRPRGTPADLAVIATTEGGAARPDQIEDRFARGLVPCLRPVHGALLTGGATAEAVLDALGVFRLSLIGEALPGMPATRSGRWVFVTKSGGFGEPDALVRLAPASQSAEV